MGIFNRNRKDEIKEKTAPIVISVKDSVADIENGRDVCVEHVYSLVREYGGNIEVAERLRENPVRLLGYIMLLKAKYEGDYT